MDTKTRHVMTLHVGDRSRRTAKRLWAKIPQAYRQHATLYTDQYVVYEGVMPAAQPRAITKLARKTNHIERFNNTLRQRVSRLVREALSFSKKLANHSKMSIAWISLLQPISKPFYWGSSLAGGLNLWAFSHDC